ncbi:hypothetical protein [Rhizobium leguminosarum]|uniref:hypothetical protein n=1 Tax=Rhizobium leguminosarum TaxID=384 RepID=UPI0004869AA9|nr:hypothetical protein [Rhizobium leguminosarum]
MRLLPFFRSRRREQSPLLSEDKRQQLIEAEGKFTEALADHAVKMDWARRIALATLEKLDERHAK